MDVPLTEIVPSWFDRPVSVTPSLALAEAGAWIVVNARSNHGEADAVAREIAARGGKALVHIGDVADAKAVQAMADAAKAITAVPPAPTTGARPRATASTAKRTTARKPASARSTAAKSTPTRPRAGIAPKNSSNVT